MLCTIVATAFMIASSVPTTDTPQPSLAALAEQLVIAEHNEARLAAAELAPAAATTSDYAGTISVTIDVVDWRNETLIGPDYPRDPESWLGVPFKYIKPIKGMMGVVRGEMSGSPGFDPVLRQYWWE